MLPCIFQTISNLSFPYFSFPSHSAVSNIFHIAYFIWDWSCNKLFLFVSFVVLPAKLFWTLTCSLYGAFQFYRIKIFAYSFILDKTSRQVKTFLFKWVEWNFFSLTQYFNYKWKKKNRQETPSSNYVVNGICLSEKNILRRLI